jgi:hypothetical protein
VADSILKTTKRLLGLGEDYTPFDAEIVLHINSVFPTLAQLGVGPSNGFMILDDTATWEDFIGEDKSLNSVITYMGLKVKMLFDPPATSFAIGAYEKQIEEFEWRMNVQRESKEWVNPNTNPPAGNVFGDPIVVDGGVG